MASDGMSAALVIGSFTATADGGLSSRLHFAAIGSDLMPIGPARCYAAAAGGAAVAPLPGGWLLAASTFDSSGQPLATVVMPVDREGRRAGASTTIPDVRMIKLVGQPGGGPLLLSLGQAVLLDVSGGVVWSRPVFGPDFAWDRAAAVFTGTGFLVAAATDNGLETAKLGLDGSLPSSQVVRGKSSYLPPELVWTGTEARLMWIESVDPNEVRWARLNGDGQIIGSPVVVATGAYAGLVPSLSGSFGMAALLPGRGGAGLQANGLSAMTIDGMGNVVVAPYPITRNPNLLGDYQLAMVDSQVIAAWIDPFLGAAFANYPNGVHLVRLTP
jgi:hypothetical protein